MPLLDSGIRALTNRLPKVVSPQTHAIIDYATAGSFFVAAALFWNHDRRAALGSLACGIAETTISLLTDYPGGVASVMDFPTHGRVDAGMAAGLEALPKFLGLGTAGWFFRAEGLSMAATAGLTDFGERDWSDRGNDARQIA